MSIGEHSNVASTGSDISAQVFIGKYTSVASHVQMHSLTQHSCIKNPEVVSTYQFTNYPHCHTEEKIIIGHDVWIGRNAVLFGGITIGHGAIIGAYSVVAKDIAPYAIVVGNPCTIIRYRYTEDQIRKLLALEWWNWSNQKVEENKADFLDIDKFLSKHLS
jgi:chloramphenicol O-acetyltransferase type B